MPGFSDECAARLDRPLENRRDVDALFPQAGVATVTLLERLGQPVEFPLEQTCCGQMHTNSGYWEVDLVRRYADTFDRSQDWAEIKALAPQLQVCADHVSAHHLDSDEALRLLWVYIEHLLK